MNNKATVLFDDLIIMNIRENALRMETSLVRNYIVEQLENEKINVVKDKVEPVIRKKILNILTINTFINSQIEMKQNWLLVLCKNNFPICCLLYILWLVQRPYSTKLRRRTVFPICCLLYINLLLIIYFMVSRETIQY